MAFAKHTPFTAEHVALADFARSLAHPARIAIVTFLQEHGEASCGAIVKALPLAQPTISQHLKALRVAGLLKQTQQGTSIHYSLNYERIQHFCHSFQCTLGTLAVETVN